MKIQIIQMNNKSFKAIKAEQKTLRQIQNKLSKKGLQKFESLIEESKKNNNIDVMLEYVRNRKTVDNLLAYIECRNVTLISKAIDEATILNLVECASKRANDIAAHERLIDALQNKNSQNF